MYTFIFFTRLIILILIGLGVYLIYRRWYEIREERKERKEAGAEEDVEND